MMVEPGDNEASIRVASGPLGGPVLGRVVGMLTARADCPIDRLDDALLVADAIAATAGSFSEDGRIGVHVITRAGLLELHVGPLRPGGADELVASASLPGVGNVLESVADVLERPAAQRRWRVPADPPGLRHPAPAAGGWPLSSRSPSRRSTRTDHILGVCGEIDLFTAPELRQVLGDCIDAGRLQIVVDLTETTFVDSTALGVLLGGFKRLRSRDGAAIREILSSLGLSAAGLHHVESYSHSAWTTADVVVRYRIVGPTGRLLHEAAVAACLPPEALLPRGGRIGVFRRRRLARDRPRTRRAAPGGVASPAARRQRERATHELAVALEGAARRTRAAPAAAVSLRRRARGSALGTHRYPDRDRARRRGRRPQNAGARVREARRVAAGDRRRPKRDGPPRPELRPVHLGRAPLHGARRPRDVPRKHPRLGSAGLPRHVCRAATWSGLRGGGLDPRDLRGRPRVAVGGLPGAPLPPRAAAEGCASTS